MLHETRKENVTMDEVERLARRIAQIKKALARLGDMRPGSLSTQTRSWGGQYAQLSYTHLGKGRTQYVPPARVKEVKRQIDNYRKFKELTQEWVTLALELCKLKQTQENNE